MWMLCTTLAEMHRVRQKEKKASEANDRARERGTKGARETEEENRVA